MRLTTSAALIMAFSGLARSQSGQVPACLADCLRNVTNPCDNISLGGLFVCLNEKCLDPASELTLTLAPKLEYACENSFVPGGGEWSGPPMTVIGDGACFTNTYEFKSFIPFAHAPSKLDNIAQNCKLDLFPDAQCLGEPRRLDLSGFRDGLCGFYVGRSVRLSCGQITDPDFNPYSYLEQMCATCTSGNSSETSPTTYGGSLAANGTVNRPSMGSCKPTMGTAGGHPYASDSPDYGKVSSSSAVATTESPMKPSVAALVAVFAAAVLML